MKNHWILHYAGTSEEDEAHLRLLLRSARKHLGEEWAWGPESEADLVMTDAQLATESPATGHVSPKGIGRALLIAADDPAPAGLFLRKPFHGDAFVALLNEVARADTGQPTPHPSALPVAEAAATGGLEPQGQPPVGNDPLSSSAKATEPTGDENLMRALLYYLPKRVLGGPARIARADAPPLVIDPDSRMFWAEGPLPALESYVRETLRLGDWQRLTGEELEEARTGADARPFAYLIWMDSYIHSKGVLSRRFDPEGTYRLSKRLDLANDYPRALRISAQMSQPRRLDAIARGSGADLAEVFDVVNAYEAIGYLEWSRPGAPPPK